MARHEGSKVLQLCGERTRHLLALVDLLLALAVVERLLEPRQFLHHESVRRMSGPEGRQESCTESTVPQYSLKKPGFVKCKRCGRDVHKANTANAQEKKAHHKRAKVIHLGQMLQGRWRSCPFVDRSLCSSSKWIHVHKPIRRWCTRGSNRAL